MTLCVNLTSILDLSNAQKLLLARGGAVVIAFDADPASRHLRLS
jgi:hypothetical protein